MIWPLINDERPASGWPIGRVIREEYVLRSARPLPAGPCRLRLDVFTLQAQSPAAKAGFLTIDTTLPAP